MTQVLEEGTLRLLVVGIWSPKTFKLLMGIVQEGPQGGAPGHLSEAVEASVL